MNYRGTTSWYFPSVPDGYQVVLYRYEGHTFFGWINLERYPLDVYFSHFWLEPFDVVKHIYRWEAVLRSGWEPCHIHCSDPASVSCCLRQFNTEEERDAALTALTWTF